MTVRPKTSLDLHLPAVRPWPSPGVDGITGRRVFEGVNPSGTGLSIAVAESRTKPSRAVLRALWEDRGGRRGLDVAVAVVHGDRVTVFGPDSDAQPFELPIGQARRQLQSVLDEPDLMSAWDRLADFRRSVTSSGIGGVTNAGLFARHYLDARVPVRSDWAQSGAEAVPLLPLRGTRLIGALGFTVQQAGGALLLSGSSGAPRAVAVLLDESESFDASSPKHQLSPVAFGLREAKLHDVDWLVVLRDDRIRLYAGRTGVGVGQKGQTETFFEVDLAAVDDEHAALLPLVFSAAALEPQGSTQQILEGSSRYGTELGARLRDRIHLRVVPPLARAVAEHLPAMGVQVDEQGLRTAYRVTLRVLFRLLFQAYAEDRGLLPAGRNERYDANSLKTAAQRDLHTDPADFGPAATLWSDLEQVWEAIDQGNAQWMVPAYNGGLFNRSRDEGALIARLHLPDSVVGPVLQALLVDVNGEGDRGPVDFSSLSVREFGTIYEGLLESSLSLAETDLTYDKDDYPVPAGPDDEVHVSAGSAYFHSASGERKATGSYFTPAIVVDHLIERSIVPVLGAHLQRIEALLVAGDEVAAGRDFFDFRVADIAMGSGHFLIAAIDRIEAMYRDFLTQHRVPRVEDELLRIHATAVAALGKDRAAVDQVENIGLLRRQVARRCIYGIDVNPLALELARLALWIHTFVPGLPMSSFDHNLVCANSLTGIGTEQEAITALEPNRPPGQASFLDDVIAEALAGVKTLLLDAANADEADKAGVREGARLRAEARTALEPIRHIFDLAVTIRTGLTPQIMVLDAEALAEAASVPAVQEAADRLNPAHMPYLFPEVFLRDRPGFDVLLGNPPWEKIKVETDQWWGLRIPKLRSLPQAQKNALVADTRAARPDLQKAFAEDLATTDAFRAVVVKGPFPGIGSGGDPDLYQAFAWRYWQLVRDGGRTAVVLPRGAMSGPALQQWRRLILVDGAFADVCFLENRAGWVFPGVHNSYTTALTVLERTADHVVRFSGPFGSEREFRIGSSALSEIRGDEFAEWSSTAAFPLIPDPKSAEVFGKLKRSPRFDATTEVWSFRPTTELHSTANRVLYEPPTGDSIGRTPVLAGASFNLWNPDFAIPFAYARDSEIRPVLESKFRGGRRNTRSAYFGISSVEIPIDRARIAFRDIARATDTRTTIACLIPPGTACTEMAPFVVRLMGNSAAEAFLLGALSSRIFDWTARRWVELHLKFNILNSLPVPRLTDSPPSARVVQIAGRLAAVDERYRVWADEVGVPVGSVTDPVEKQDLIDELDALVALLYGLTADQVEHIYATFHRGWAYGPRLAAVLVHFDAWKDRA